MIATVLLAAVLASPVSGRAQETPAPTSSTLTDDEVRERVHAYLGAIDRPVRADAWRALGPAAVPHLEAVLRGDDLPTRRAAAASGLAAIGGDRARAALLDTARAEDERFVVRSAAIRGAARVVPATELVPVLQPVLAGARSAHVRTAAAEALAGSAVGCRAVRTQAQREGTAGHERFAKALARCRTP